MKEIIIVTLISIFNTILYAQENWKYLDENTVDVTDQGLKFDSSFYENQVYLFGFIHGSATPQEMDYRILENLCHNGVKYYAPEVDISLAYFLNKYLESGNEDLLQYITYYYSNNVPQDASHEFMAKWRKIYALNKTFGSKEKIKIIGFDRMIDEGLSLTHLANLAPIVPTGISEIDGLKEFTNTTFEEIHIKSGKPVIKSGKSWSYFFGGEKAELFQKLKSLYSNDSQAFLSHFGVNSNEVDFVMKNITQKNREERIFMNFMTIASPIIEKGKKIYGNFGYFHIQQGPINGKRPFAAMIKEETTFSIVSIQGLLIDSECLDHAKLCSDGTLAIKEVKFKKMKYCGYRVSSELDGHTKKEKVSGIEYFENIAGNEKSIFLTCLYKNDSPFLNLMMFADFKQGSENWQVDPNLFTTDYFQYLVVMNRSAANTHRLE
ncbi:MAG: hypothetical protein KJ941_00030 [Bacteroidetes bacterium]|nr:hypothetical protein [Bacteroidota bacterium]